MPQAIQVLQVSSVPTNLDNISNLARYNPYTLLISALLGQILLICLFTKSRGLLLFGYKTPSSVIKDFHRIRVLLLWDFSP